MLFVSCSKILYTLFLKSDANVLIREVLVYVYTIVIVVHWHADWSRLWWPLWSQPG